jgi:hypothetical protein
VLGVLAVVLYLAAAGLVRFAAAWVRRPIPWAAFTFLALLPLAFFFPDIALDRTRLPTDQTYLFAAAAADPSHPRNPWLNDVATQFLPWAVKVRESWRAGEVPLRDRWNGCGSALAAGGTPGAFSPLTLIGLPLPLVRAFGLAAAIKGLAAVIGMWLWLRELRVSPPASLFGAVSFALSFSIVPWIFFPQAAAIAVWPWVFFAAERLRDADRAGRAFALLVAVLAIWPLLGHVESVVSGAALFAVVLAARWVCGDVPDALRLCWRAALAGAAAAGLVAFALLPQALAILASNRRVLTAVPFYEPHFSWIPHGFLWPGWRTTLFPGAFGDGIERPMLPGSGAAYPEMALGYVGVAGWALALLVLRPGSRRARITAGLLAAIALALGIGLGAWPFAEIAGHLPLFRWMMPVRILSWIALAGSTLAALELDRWLADGASLPSWKAVLAATGAALVLALLAWDAQSRYDRALGPPAGFPAHAEAFEATLWCLAAFTVSAALVLMKSTAVHGAVPYVFVLVTGTELTLQALRQYRAGPAGDVFPATPLAGFLRSRPGPFRVVGEGFDFLPQKNAVVGVEDVRTHDPVERRDYVDFLNSTCGYPPADYFKSIISLNAPALDFLNVRYLVSFPWREKPGEKWTLAYSGPDGSVFENRQALPRVFAPRRFLGVAGVSPKGWIRSASPLFGEVLTEIARLPDFHEKALVLGAPAGERANGQVEISGYTESTNRATFHARVRGGSPETLLVSSLVQDGGWSVRGEGGRRLAATLANGPFLAVWLPDGESEVVLDYAPPGWREGLAVSTGALVLLAALALRATWGMAPSPTGRGMG